MANRILIGIAEMVVADDPEIILCAPHLGSCLGISAYDPKKRIGAMIHCLLPLSKSDPAKAAEKPYMYTDTGFAAMIEDLLQRGSEKKDLIICVAGGASINDKNNVFEIGKKNYTVLRKLMWKNNLLLKAEHVGDEFSRTISLSIATGEVSVSFNSTQIKLY